MNKISVIIPTMNRLESLSRTFSHIENAKPVPYEIIVVDQTQEKAMAERIENLCKQSTLNVIYKWNSVPSLTKARNTGLELTNGEIIVFMDDDVDVHDDTFANVIKLMSDSGIAMAGGFNERDIPKSNSKLGYIFNQSSYKKRKIGHMTSSVMGRFPLRYEEQVPSEWAMGFFFVVRKQLINKWGVRFDENLKYYAFAEDLDFTYSYYCHAKDEGLRCLMSSMLTVSHNVSQEYRIPKFSATMMEVLHRFYIGCKYNPKYKVWPAMAWSTFGTYLYRLIHNEAPNDVIRSFVFLIKNRRCIQTGNFRYEKFM